MKRRRSPFSSDSTGVPPATPTCSSCSCCCVLTATAATAATAGVVPGLSAAQKCPKREVIGRLFITLVSAYLACRQFGGIISLGLGSVLTGAPLIVVSSVISLVFTVFVVIGFTAVFFRPFWTARAQLFKLAAVVLGICMLTSLAFTVDVVTFMSVGSDGKTEDRFRYLATAYPLAASLGAYGLFRGSRFATRRFFPTKN